MRYETIMRGKWMFDGSKSLLDMIDRCWDMANELQEMHKAGVKLTGEVGDDYAFLETEDGEVAKKFGMEKAEDEDEV